MAFTTGFKRQRNSEEKRMTLRKRPSNKMPFMNALLVDNVITSRLVEQSRLLSLGIDTMVVNNVQEALEILVAGARFDFIVVDFDLAIINGPELVTQIRVMGIQSKILGLCTNYNLENRHMFYEAGANACIEKPINPEILEEVIGNLRNM